MFDLGDEVGGFVTEVAILPRSAVADALLSVFENDGARGDEVMLLGGLEAMLEQFAALLAVNALCNTVLVPRGPIDDAETALCEIFVADLRETCKVLALEEVPPLFLSCAGAEVVVLASTGGVECVLYTKLLDITGALLVAVHARCAVFGMLVGVEGADVAHGYACLGIDTVKHLVKGSFAGECIGASRHDGESDIDSLCSEGIV